MTMTIELLDEGTTARVVSGTATLYVDEMDDRSVLLTIEEYDAMRQFEVSLDDFAAIGHYFAGR